MLLLMVSKGMAQMGRLQTQQLESNMSSDGEEGRCQIFNSLSTYAPLLSEYLSATTPLVCNTKPHSFKGVSPFETC